MSYVVKGGRVPGKIKTIANLLRLRPVLGIKKGKLKARGVLYGKSRMVEKFAMFVTKKIDSNKQYRIIIAHANSKVNGDKLSELLISKNSNIEEKFILELGCALGAHAGPGALAVGIQEID